MSVQDKRKDFGFVKGVLPDECCGRCDHIAIRFCSLGAFMCEKIDRCKFFQAKNISQNPVDKSNEDV